MHKKRFLKLILICVFCLGLATPAQAGRFFGGLGAGTLGVGADVGYQFSNLIKFRINANYLPVDVSMNIDHIDYDAEFKNFTAGFLLDVHPFMGNFRITAGAYYRDQSIDLDAKPKYGRTIGGQYFTREQIGTLKAEATWDKFAPYLGIGWGMGSGTDMDFSIDFNLGAMYMSGLSIDYWMTGTAAQAAIGTSQYQQYIASIDREAQKVKDDIDDFKWYPVVSIFFSFRF